MTLQEFLALVTANCRADIAEDEPLTRYDLILIRSIVAEALLELVAGHPMSGRSHPPYIGGADQGRPRSQLRPIFSRFLPVLAWSPHVTMLTGRPPFQPPLLSRSV